jgi:hypothetical protein
MEYTMKITKTLSTLSLALALQAGVLIAASVVLFPSEASAAGKKKSKAGKINSMDSIGGKGSENQRGIGNDKSNNNKANGRGPGNSAG